MSAGYGAHSINLTAL